jgi:DNA-binding response OmpR family regulator
MIRKENPNIPIIMVTSLPSIDDKVEGYDSGADDYIVKPFEFKELLLKIRVLLKRTMFQQIPMGNILQADDLAMSVWDIDFERNTNVIDVYISYLRNKVDKKFEHKLIQTQIGMGYILKDH